MNTNVKDRLRCAYEHCAEAHPLANESTYEQVTCPTCRAALGLPPIEIYKNSGETVAATPKPRAGEHTPGPWIVSSTFLVCDAEARVLAQCQPMLEIPALSPGTAQAKANARRIVACVNACEGINTMLLENVEPKSPAAYFDLARSEQALKGQQSELVDFIEAVKSAFDQTVSINLRDRVQSKLYEAARALLAKHGR